MTTIIDGSASADFATPLPLTEGGTGATSNIGTVASVTMLQTRTQDSYSAPTTGDGTVITPLNITFTPKQAGNKVILAFYIRGEADDSSSVFLVSRNGVLLADSTDASNNRWAGVAGLSYDTNTASTPNNMTVSILDLNTLAIESTYKVQIRSADAGAHTFRLNRSYSSAGADSQETSVSVSTATEIWA